MAGTSGELIGYVVIEHLGDGFIQSVSRVIHSDLASAKRTKTHYEDVTPVGAKRFYTVAEVREIDG